MSDITGTRGRREEKRKRKSFLFYIGVPNIGVGKSVMEK
jgi:hypothetical protein